MFVSTYFLEHLSTTFLDQAPFEYFYAWDSNSNPLFWLTTSSCEAFFPQLVQQFGPAIPIDLNFRILQAHNFNSTPGQLSL